MSTSPISPSKPRNFLADSDTDNDSESQRSISLSSPPDSSRNSAAYDAVDLDTEPVSSTPSATYYSYQPSTIPSDSSRTLTSLDSRDTSKYTTSSSGHSFDKTESVTYPVNDSLRSYNVVDPPPASATSTSFSPDTSYARPPSPPALPTYPPTSNDTDSVLSFASTSSRKARPESMLIIPPEGPLVLGVALVDFNHLVGPRIEWSKGEIFDDDEVSKILPFLALPDGAHLTVEDYSYFHLVPSGPKPTTVFGISCNRQIPSTQLLVKEADVTRSTVQKAVVVIASKPLFGPIRDKLGVITQALFLQRDFTSKDILDDFGTSLEISLRTQLTESGLYMGTNLRSLVHLFRQRTLILVKCLMLQKKILFYGHPVESLCTYQYSLVSLFPGLLQTLDDSGSPPLNARATTLTRATSLKTSDNKSMMAFMGQPLDLFGQDSFFQPYLPLQQVDMLKDTRGWLCGTTNSIITHRNETDLVVNIETGALEFRDPALERISALTAADRKWMDDLVRDVNDGYDETDPSRSVSMQFKGSDDYLRSKFEEYISSALASVKYQDFLAKGEGSGVLITGATGGDPSSVEDFNPLWLSEYRRTNAYEVWNAITDPLMFDIVEARHPCNEKPSVVSDIGLRLTEGIQEMKLEQQLAPAREAVSRTIATGSTNFFKAVEGVRGWAAQKAAERAASAAAAESEAAKAEPTAISRSAETANEAPPPLASRFSFLRRTSLAAESSLPTIAHPPAPSPPQSTGPTAAETAKASLSTWGAGIGTFLASRRTASTSSNQPATGSVTNSPLPSTPGSPNSYVNLSPVDDAKTPSKATFGAKDGSEVKPTAVRMRSEDEMTKELPPSLSKRDDDDDYRGAPAGMAM